MNDKIVLEDVDMGKLKEEAKNLIDKLPDSATLDDLMYELYVNQKIQNGLDAIENGEFQTHEDVKKRFMI